MAWSTPFDGLGQMPKAGSAMGDYEDADPANLESYLCSGDDTYGVSWGRPG